MNSGKRRKKVVRRFWWCLAAAFFLAAVLLFSSAYKEAEPFVRDENRVTELKNLVTETSKGEDFLERKIDFEALREINEEIAGWVFIPGTAVDYPVLIGKDDLEYLTKDFRKEENAAGSVFAFADTARDLSEGHLCLFGHNMKAAAMFGELKNYKDEAYAFQNGTLYLYTPEYAAEYMLFSVYECKKTDDSFRHKLPGNGEEFTRLLKEIAEKNQVNLGAGTEENNGENERQIVTLTCCSDYNRTVNRLTVHFIRRKTLYI